MDTLAFFLIGAVFLAFAVVSRPLAETPITPPLVFAGLGAVLGPIGLSLASIEVSHGAVELLAEITLALVLFSDAARIPHREEILGIAMAVVALSILAHGLTAAPLARAYGRMAERKGACPESEPVPEMRLRVRAASPIPRPSNPKT